MVRNPDESYGTSIVMRSLAQRLLDAIASERTDGRRLRLVIRLRRMLLRVADPIVEYPWHGSTLRVPLSHDLPLHRRASPRYSFNLGGTAALVQKKYESLTVVDVGANVGDSALLLTATVGCPILCVEADDVFAPLLRSNVAAYPQIVVEESFIGCRDSDVALDTRIGGTARLRSGTGAKGLKTVSLSAVLEAHGDFRSSKLLKIDTDGWDVEVLRGAEAYIRAIKPVIFFEYDPHSLELAGEADAGFGTFGMLSDWGYEAGLFFDNFGDFMIGVDLSARDELSDLHRRVATRRAELYWDVVVFSEEDRDIFDAARRPGTGAET